MDEAIELLRRSTSQSPNRAGHQILLAQLLLQRVGGPGSPTRTADLAEAQRCALFARDSRRRWHGNSGEAAAVACQVAFLDHDYRGALRVGVAVPEGEATNEEAGDLAVLSFVSRAFLAAGDFARAKETAERSENQCLQALIAAKASLFSDPSATEAGIEHVQAAWSLAETDADRLDIQVTAAGLGMWPLPGQADLESRDDDMAAVLLAQSEHVQGRDNDAIARLRQYEGSSEQCAMVLAQIYADQGRTDEAVEELRHAANRFQRPSFLLPGAQFLMRAGRNQEAKELATAALAEMDAGAPARRDARLFLIEMARMQSNWHEVEGQARALVTENSGSTDYRWLLVTALFNQQRREEAWQACIADGGLTPMNANQAALWAQLHCSFDPGVGTTLAVAELLEHYLEDAQVAAVLVGALLTMDSSEPIPQEAQERWNAALGAFLTGIPTIRACARSRWKRTSTSSSLIYATRLARVRLPSMT